MTESSAHMSIVDVDVKGDIFCAIVLETPDTAAYLQTGKPVTLLFKETEVSIGKNLSGLISLRNRVKSRVKKIIRQGILTLIILDYKNFKIQSIISSRSCQKMDLKEGDEVEWLVKTTEMSLQGG